MPPPPRPKGMQREPTQTWEAMHAPQRSTSWPTGVSCQRCQKAAAAEKEVKCCDRWRKSGRAP